MQLMLAQPAALKSPADHLDEFDRLDALRRQLLLQRAMQPAALEVFFDRDSSGFKSTLEKPAGHLSPSSTATCISSLIRGGQWEYGPWRDFGTELLTKLITDDQITTSGLERSNIYTTAFLLEAASDLKSIGVNPSNEEIYDERVAAMSHRLDLSLSSGSVAISEYPPSAYLTQLTLRTLRRFQEPQFDLLLKVSDWAWAELCRQISLSTAHSKTVDYFQLAYCIVILTSIDLPQNALPEQRLLIDTGIQIFFEAQLVDGTWPKSAPIFDIPGKGSSYCYEYELLTQLLTEPRLEDRLLPYLPNLGEAYLALTRTSYDLTERADGWASGHRPRQGPESWSTSSCYSFIFLYERLIAEALRRTVFSYLRNPYSAPTRPLHEDQPFAPSLLDSRMTTPDKRANSLKETILTRFIQPIALQALDVKGGRRMQKGTATTAVLFGPPGTSKTQLASLISQYLGWPLLSIDPSDFVRSGIGSVGVEADRLFDMIASLECVVVLVDEIDELVRARENERDSSSRFLTTSLLPKLATINSSRRLVFIVATNHIESFDLAISRPGRFDAILQIMPPTAEQKLLKWPALETLAKTGDRARQKQLDIELAALTYSEAEQLARRIDAESEGQEASELLDLLYGSCTLSSEASLGKTWLEVSTEQVRYIRIPARMQ